MTFTAGNLFPSHSCIDVTRVKPPLGFEPRSSAESWTTYQLSYLTPYIIYSLLMTTPMGEHCLIISYPMSHLWHNVLSIRQLNFSSIESYVIICMEESQQLWQLLDSTTCMSFTKPNLRPPSWLLCILYW